MAEISPVNQLRSTPTSFLDAYLGGPDRKAASVVIFMSSVFTGITALGIPLQLHAVGLTKAQIAIFFVVGAGIAVTYNVALLPRLPRQRHAAALRITTLLVPVGTILILAGAGTWPLLYVGALLMLFVTTVPPQVLGSVAKTRDGADEIVMVFRQIMVAGYISGLALYTLSATVGVNALATASFCAVLSSAASWSNSFLQRPIETPAEPVEAGSSTPILVVTVCAVLLVGLMKAVDTIRSIYLPLFAVNAGIRSGAIGGLFVATAVAELFVLPVLRRTNARFGPAMTLVAVSFGGLLAFVLVLSSTTGGVLFTSQLIYAVFGAGFQSVGMVLLSRTAGHDVRRGAARFVAVMQSGTVLGATLPLLMPGYGPRIFVSAIGLCSACVVLGLVLARTMSGDAFSSKREVTERVR
jgi:hypothetical protein